MDGKWLTPHQVIALEPERRDYYLRSRIRQMIQDEDEASKFSLLLVAS